MYVPLLMLDMKGTQIVSHGGAQKDVTGCASVLSSKACNWIVQPNCLCKSLFKMLIGLNIRADCQVLSETGCQVGGAALSLVQLWMWDVIWRTKSNFNEKIVRGTSS